METSLWQTISSTLLQLAERTTGLSAQWVNEPRKHLTVGQRVYLEVLSVRSIGVDEIRAEATNEPQPALNYRQRLVGNRAVTITVTVESLNQSPDKSARVFLERFRFGLRRPSSLATLQAANLAIVGMQALTNRDRVEDSRMISVASLDLTIACSANDPDLDAEATSTIDTVELENRVRDTDGSILPSSIARTSEPVGYVPAPPGELVDVTQIEGVVDVWDPTEFGSLSLEDSDRVIEWYPLVESYNVVLAQTGSSARPTYVPDAFGLGYPGVQFDGIDDRVAAAAGDNDWRADATIVFVAMTTQQAGVILQYADEAASPSRMGLSIESSSGRTRAVAGPGEVEPDGSLSSSAYVSDALATPRVVSFRFKRSLRAYLGRVNFVDVPTTSFPPGPEVAPSLGVAGFGFGASRSSPHRHWGGILGRVAVFNRILTPAELLDVERWAAAGAGLYVPPSVAAVCLPRGESLEGYWRFDGTLDDVSGAQRHLAAAPSPGVSYSGGARGLALSVGGNPARSAFRNANDTAFDLYSADFTIHAWVKFSDTSGDQVLIEKFNSLGQGWSFLKLTDNSVMFFGSLVGGYIGTPSAIPTNTWHRFAARKAGGDFRVWFNNELIINSFASGGFAHTTTTGLVIGRRGASAPGVAALNGSIDEVLFWRRALAVEDINQLWNSGAGYPVCVP